MSRPRHRSRRNWPDYLTARPRSGGLYYYWKHPGTGQEFGLGYEFMEAAAEAREANLKLAAERTQRPTLANRLDSNSRHTMAKWLDEFALLLSKRKGKKRGTTTRAAGTIARDQRWIEVLRGHFKDTLITKVTTLDCAELIKTYTDAGKERTAYNIRSFVVDCFGEAEAAGWIPRGTNPATITRAENTRTERTRLDLAQFQAILAEARKSKKPWVEQSMLLAILTGQRRSDVAAMKFSDVLDGYLHVVQIKYHQKIRISLGLGLPEVGMTVGEIIAACRRRGIVGAKHIIHQSSTASRSESGAPLSGTSLTRGFSSTRDKVFSPDTWAEGTPATFHEIRALSKQLYNRHGIDTKALLGHDDDKMDALYSDPREGWRTVEPAKARRK